MPPKHSIVNQMETPGPTTRAQARAHLVAPNSASDTPARRQPPNSSFRDLPAPPIFERAAAVEQSRVPVPTHAPVNPNRTHVLAAEPQREAALDEALSDSDVGSEQPIEQPQALRHQNDEASPQPPFSYASQNHDAGQYSFRSQLLAPSPSPRPSRYDHSNSSNAEDDSSEQRTGRRRLLVPPSSLRSSSNGDFRSSRPRNHRTRRPHTQNRHHSYRSGGSERPRYSRRGERTSNSSMSHGSNFRTVTYVTEVSAPIVMNNVQGVLSQGHGRVECTIGHTGPVQPTNSLSWRERTDDERDQSRSRDRSAMYSRDSVQRW